MPDPQSIVDDIRCFLQASDRTEDGSLAELARGYAEACAGANERLNRCALFLRQGLRSEAIHLAEAEPNLLGLVAVLDFPERAEWEELVFAHRLARPPALVYDAAEALNEAYAEEEPLQNLLRRHRALALARAPLAERMAVMQQVATLDAENPIWRDDLLIFAKARWQQIQAEAEAAAGRHNGEQLAALARELEAPHWPAPPPTMLLHLVQKASTQVRRIAARKRLGELEPELNQAHAALDVAAGNRLRREWSQRLHDAGLASSDPLRERVGPALDWLEAEDRRAEAERIYQDDLAALEAALDEGAPRRELVCLMQALLGHDREVDPALESRYGERLAYLDRAHARRLRIGLGAAAATILLIGGFTAYLLLEQAHVRNVERVVATTSRMLDAEQFEEAAAYLATLGGRVASAPELAEVRARLKSGRDRENRRHAAFAQAVADAEQAPIRPGPDGELERVRILARRPQERNEVDQLAHRRERAFRAAQERTDQELLGRVAEVNAQLRPLESRTGKALGTEPMQALLRNLELAAADMSARALLASEPVRARLREISARIGTVRKRLEGWQQHVQLVDLITQALFINTSGSIDRIGRYAAAVADYIKAFPTTPRARAMEQALREQSLWKDSVAWEDVLAAWSRPYTDLSPAAAAQRASQCRQLLSNHPHLPDRADIEQFANYAESVARREGNAESAKEKLLELFNDVLVGDLRMIKTKKGQRYYVKGALPTGNLALSFPYVAGFDGRERRASLPSRDVAFQGVAPQTLLAGEVRRLLECPTLAADWDRKMLEIMGKVKDEPDLDPVLRMALLRQVIAHATEASTPLQRALARHAIALDRVKSELNVPWMDPESREADSVRPTMQRAFEALPGLENVPEAVAQDRMQIERSLVSKTLLGWLEKTDDAGWVCHTMAHPDDGVELWVVLPNSNQDGHWQTIGRVDRHEPRIEPVDSGSLLEGRLVLTAKPPPLRAERQAAR